MINLIYEYGQLYKDPEEKYEIALPTGEVYEAADLAELTACICGHEFLDSQSAETDWHMRRSAANALGMNRLMNDELEAGRELPEDVIVYDERWGKIPYSLTDVNIDYDIHVPVDQLTIIRIESNKSFLYTLVKYNFIEVMERNEETGEYEKWSEKPDLDDLIEAEADYFRKYGDQERIPFLKKIGE